MTFTKDFWTKFKKALPERVATVAATALITAVITSWIVVGTVDKHEARLDSVEPVVTLLYENQQDYTALDKEVDTLHHGVDSLKVVIVKTNEVVTRLEEKFDQAKIEDNEERSRLWRFLEKYFENR